MTGTMFSGRTAGPSGKTFDNYMAGAMFRAQGKKVGIFCRDPVSMKRYIDGWDLELFGRELGNYEFLR